MSGHIPAIGRLLLVTSGAVLAGALGADAAGPRTAQALDARVVTVSAGMLSSHIDRLAGRRVYVPGVRVVGTFGPRALVVEPAARLSAPVGYRHRLLVLVREGGLQVDETLVVGATVELVGTARTPLGLQVTGEVPWPAALDRARMARLDIRAAVLASSVRTAEGVELTGVRAAGPDRR